MRCTQLALTAAISGLLAWQAATAIAQSQNDKPKPAARPWTAPRMPDGQPDIQGVWLNDKATPLERPEALKDKPTLTDKEVADLQERADRIFSNGRSDFPPGIDQLFLAALGNVETYRNPTSTENDLDLVHRTFENRTSLVVDPPDGRIPPLTREAQAQRRNQGRGGPSGPEDLSNNQRCITYGVPPATLYTPPYGYFQIMQARGYVVLEMEILTTRIIPLDGRPHMSDRIRQWDGDSRGRWDGNTLVVDTTNFPRRGNFQGAGERLHVVEKFTRTSPDTMDYEAKLEDPDRWTRPWTVALHLKRTDDSIYEFACHEGNYETMKTILNSPRTAE
jgi:hypothetical protein